MLLHIPGYTIFRRDRDLHGGGVCLYVRNGIRCKSPVPSPSVESLSLPICLTGHTQSQKVDILLCTVYRPPNSTLVFWTDFARYIEPMMDTADHTIVLGDFNANIISPTPTHHVKHLTDLCSELVLQNRVHIPTRPTSHSCLDLALTSQYLPHPQVAVTSTLGLSDHDLLTLDFLFSQLATFPQRKFITRRKPHLHSIDERKLNDTIALNLNACEPAVSIPTTSPSPPSPDVNSWAISLSSSLVNVLNDLAPVKRIVVPYCPRPRTQPWVTADLKKLLVRRAYLHRKSRKRPNDQRLQQDYRANRREGTLLNRKLKTQYLKNKFTQLKHNPRGQWRLLNTLSGRSTVHTTPSATLPDLTQTFASIVNDATRPPQLALPPVDGPSPFHTFKDVTTADVELMLKSVNVGKASGSDGVPANLLKLGRKPIAPFLRDIINESLSSGVFPDTYKIAHICPVFKSGDRETASNYRPISLLPIASKLLERTVHTQLMRYIDTVDGALPPQQFAYRRHHSCEDALALAINAWQLALDGGDSVGIAFVDMTKAFDRVNHQQLITTLTDIGIGGTALSWFANYLTGRKQYVKVDGAIGLEAPCLRGVPQGSVLGPLLFCLYIRTIPAQLQNNNQLYADDICVFTSHKSTAVITSRLNADLAHLHHHLAQKGLALNPTKTKFLILHRPTVPIPGDVHLVCNSTVIPLSSSVKYLGIIIDAHLRFDLQVKRVCDSAHGKVAAFRHGRRHLTTAARRIFYLTIVQSTLEYASNAYFHTLSSTLHNRIITASHIAMRKVFGLSRFTSADTILQRYCLHSLDVRVNLKLYLFVFRCIHARASVLLCDLFTLRSVGTRTSATTRGQDSSSLCLPPCRSRFGYYSISFLAADRWNALPSACRQCSSSSAFIRHVKQFLLP